MKNCLLKLSVIMLSVLGLAACSSQGNYAGSTAPDWHYSDTYVPGHSPDIDTPLLHVTNHVISNVAAGETFETAMDVYAKKPVQDIVITHTVPAGATVVKTEPAATQQGNKLVWKFDQMDRDDMQPIRIWLKSNTKGMSSMCTTVDAKPRTCHEFFVGQPDLQIEKTGPTNVRLGNKFDYQIVVKNNGNMAAQDVKVVDQLPSQLRGMDTPALSYDVGELQPGQSTQPIIIHATGNERGDFCNVAQVTASNHPMVEDQACTTIYQPMVSISKTGTSTTRLGQQADYTLTVNNPGDVALSNVTVTDNAPQYTRITSATGANVQGNTATWTIDQLPAGSSRQFNVSLTSRVAGTLCNQAQVAAGDLNDNTQACTEWQGVPSLLVEMVDTRDSLLVGETTQYQLSVKNQGTADDSNVNISVTLPDTLQPVAASNNGTVNGQNVTFSVAKLPQGQTENFTIDVKAVKPGSKNTTARVTTDGIPTAVVEQENTTVY